MLSIRQLGAQVLAGTKEREDGLAYVLSQVLSPPVIAVAGAVLAATSLNTPAAWLWGGVYIAGAVLVPLVYVLWLVARGVVADIHLPSRRDRLRPNVVAVAAAWAVWAAMWHSAAPEPLRLLAVINVAQTMLFLAITLWWKISLHLIALTALFALSLWFLGAAAWPLAVLVPALAWSRVYLGRHTLSQTLAGMGVGGGVVAACLLLSG